MNLHKHQYRVRTTQWVI